MLKKFTTLLLSFFLLSFLFVPTVHAEDQKSLIQQMSTIYCNRRSGNQMNLETWYGGKCPKAGTKPEEMLGFGNIIILDLYEKLAGSGNDTSMQDLIKSLLGVGNTSLKDIPKPTLGNNGLLQDMSILIGSVSQPAISSADYFQYVAQNLTKNKIVQPAYAQEQGIGFNALIAVLPVWRAFRNIVYMIFVLVFILYGFLIMFRVNLGKQAVATIQTVLPKIIIALILVTFSYAIGGLVIDFFYVVSGLGFSLLTNAGLATGSSNVIDQEFAKIAYGYHGLLSPFIMLLGYIFTGNLFGRVLAFFIPTALASILSTGGVFLLATPLGWILPVLLIIVFLILFIRIFWMLLKSFVMINLSVMFSPIILLQEVLPGSTAFVDWLKGLVAEVSTFIVTSFMMFFGFYFLGPIVFVVKIAEVGPLDVSKNFWAPFPLGGAGGSDSTGKFAILGLGILLMIPKIADIVHEKLKVPAFKYGSDIAKGLAPITGLASYGTGFAKRGFTEAVQKPITGAFDSGVSAVMDRSKSEPGTTPASRRPGAAA